MGNGKRGKPKGYTSIMVQKPKPWGGRRKRRRGRWANRDKDNEDYDQEEDMPYLSMDLEKHISNNFEDTCDRVSSRENDFQKNSQDKFDDFKIEAQSSNGSEDSRSSFNDRKSKDSNFDSPESSGGKSQTKSSNRNITRTRGVKRERDDTSIESGSDYDVNYSRGQKKNQKKLKAGKLDSNPLLWSVDDVFKYLRKTTDCKDVAYKVRQEVIKTFFHFKNISTLFFSFY